MIILIGKEKKILVGVSATLVFNYDTIILYSFWFEPSDLFWTWNEKMQSLEVTVDLL